MKKGHVTENFHIKELVHPLFIEKYGEQKMIVALHNYAPFMLLGIEQLKAFIGGNSVTINNYKWGGNFQSSGVRHHDDPVGAQLSAHYYMCATDCKFKHWSVADLQQQILENPKAHPYILRMEAARYTPTWLHVQWGYRLPNKLINVFKP